VNLLLYSCVAALHMSIAILDSVSSSTQMSKVVVGSHGGCLPRHCLRQFCMHEYLVLVNKSSAAFLSSIKKIGSLCKNMH